MKASTLSNVHSTRTPVDTLLPAPQHGHAPPACSNGAVIHAFPKGGPAMFAHPAGTCARVVHVHVPCLDRSRGQVPGFMDESEFSMVDEDVQIAQVRPPILGVAPPAH